MMLAITLPVHYYSGDHIASAIKQEKERKLMKIGKEEMKLFADDMVVHREHPTKHTIHLLELIREFSKVTEFNVGLW